MSQLRCPEESFFPECQENCYKRGNRRESGSCSQSLRHMFFRHCRFSPKQICGVLECHLSSLFGRPKSLVASVCHSCLFTLCKAAHRVDISFF